MKPWLVSAALPVEAELLQARLTPAPTLGLRPCWQGQLGERPVFLILTGLGMVNAAQAVTAALEVHPEIEAVLNLGCAGAYAGSGLELGQAALATQAVLADLGIASARGWRPLDKLGIPLMQDPAGSPIYHRLPADPALNQMLDPGGTLPRGIFATVAQVSGDQSVARDLAQRWGALLEDMESAAVAQVALWYGKPFAALRGVSNLAGQRELEVKAGARAAQEALLAALER